MNKFLGEKHGYGGLIAATIIAGMFQIVMGLARMGNLIKFIPWPVTSGFTTWIAVSIIATGAPDLLGIHGAGPVPREFLAKVQWLFENLSRSNLASLLLALLVIAIILRKAGFIDVIGRENLCAHFDAALSRAKALLAAPDRAEGPAD